MLQKLGLKSPFLFGIKLVTGVALLKLHKGYGTLLKKTLKT